MLTMLLHDCRHSRTPHPDPQTTLTVGHLKRLPHTMPLTYTTGDATQPQGGGPQLLIHCCNDEGGWGSGFVLALNRRFGTGPGSPRHAYRTWHHQGLHPQASGPFELGHIQTVTVDDSLLSSLHVINMIGQHKTINSLPKGAGPPIRYDALKAALRRVRQKAIQLKASVHAPRFGAGLAGGNWHRIEQLIDQQLTSHNIDVTIYDLPTR